MKPYAGTQAVLRAVTVLKAFHHAQPDLSLAELTGIVGLNKTTAYRLLTALESEGMVQRNPDGDAWRLGPELLALGSRAFGASDLRLTARPELLALAHRTRETATLEVLVGAHTLILDEGIGDHVIGAMPSVGTRWPAHATSTGKVLLAGLPEAEREAILGGELAALTPRTITAPGALRRELARVRQRGFAIAVEELEPGFVAIAAPVRTSEGRTVAAIGIGGPKGRLTPERVAEIARQVPAAAARVSERLGLREPKRQAAGAGPAGMREARR